MSDTPKRAPCWCPWRSPAIVREFRILFPTVLADCRCGEHNSTWTERLEFDFSVPLGGATWENASACPFKNPPVWVGK